MKKKDLKTGMVVELRNKKKLMVIKDTKCGDALIAENDFFCLCDYNKDLECPCGPKIERQYDIMKVYDIQCILQLQPRTINEERPLLWERKEILNKEEKEYLSAVIKPFRKKIFYIEKRKMLFDFDNVEYIRIKIDNELDKFIMDFPLFAPNTMYKGMEANKQYTLEELGL